jgi:hypothetical protein
MLNSFFGGKKDRSKKKKKAIQGAISGAPSSTVVPQQALPEATATPSPVTSP